MADWSDFLARLLGPGGAGNGILGQAAQPGGLLGSVMLPPAMQGGQPSLLNAGPTPDMLAALSPATGRFHIGAGVMQPNQVSGQPSQDRLMQPMSLPSHDVPTLQGQNLAPEAADTGDFWSRKNGDGTSDILGGFLKYDPKRDVGGDNRMGLIGATLADAGASLGGHPDAARNVQAFREYQTKLAGRKALAEVLNGIGGKNPLPQISPALTAPPRLGDNAPAQLPQLPPSSVSPPQSYYAGNPGPTNGRTSTPFQSANGAGAPVAAGPSASGSDFNLRALAPKLAELAASGVDVSPVVSILKELGPKDLDHSPHEAINPATGKMGMFVFDQSNQPQWLNVGVPSKAPTTRTVRQGTQEITQEYEPQSGTWKQVATGDAFKPADPADAGGGLNDAAKINAAVRYNLNGTLPSFGMGKAARQDRLDVLNYAADLSKGIKPEQLVANVANFKANSASLSQQTKQFNSIEQNANTAKNSLNLAIASAKAGGAGPTDSPVFNRWVQAGRIAVNGDPQVKALQNHLSAFAEDYAKVMTANTSAAGATDRAALEAHNRLSAANSVDSLEKISAEMLKEMGGRHYAARAQIGAIQKQLGGGSYSEPQGVQTAPPPQPLPRLGAALPRLPGGMSRGVKWKVVGQ